VATPAASGSALGPGPMHPASLHPRMERSVGRWGDVHLRGLPLGRTVAKAYHAVERQHGCGTILVRPVFSRSNRGSMFR